MKMVSHAIFTRFRYGAAMSKLILLFSLSLPMLAFAQTANREESLKVARAWQRPTWISTDFKFGAVDVFNGPTKSAWEMILDQEPLACTVTDKDLKRATHGMTNKFYCSFDAKHSAKFKYKFDDGEITSEILSTRLFWALGFGADRVYFKDVLNCAGCTAHPFKNRRIDPKTLKKPRKFENLAVERKFAPSYIGRGWTYQELMETSSASNFIERDALRLLSVFVQHADNKAENQDLACFGDETPGGGCTGPTFMLVQDLGATFGSGQIDDTTMSKAIFKDWEAKRLWRDRRRCIANLGDNAEGEMEEPQISEEARAFLAQLLVGFSEGAAGRKRVEDLFRAGHAEWRGGTIEQWTNAFYAKVAEVNQPCGK